MLQMNEGDAVAVIVAAGQGSRMGANHNKLLLQLGKRTILETSLEPFLLHPRIRKIFLATAPQDQQKINKFISEEVA
jgi:2-C-methyl-D-erythritol 4-phosphate cytidylyltransferase